MNTTLTTEYWVVDEAGSLADPDRIATVPGADGTASPYSVAIETPPCETASELQTALDDRLAATVGAARDCGCRLLALGLRPDLLADERHANQSRTDQPSLTATAGTRISFEINPAAAVDIYNVLLALDPVFVLVNTTSRVDGRHQYACGRPSFAHHERQVPPYRTDLSESTVVDSSELTVVDSSESTTVDPRTPDWQPVRLLDGGSRIEWRSLDTTTPTLLIDLIADVQTILETASEYRIEIDSFGNGFQADRLVLPNETWRQRYTEEAVRKGVASLPVRAYLERLGVETEWYRAAAPPTVGVQSTTDLPAVCRHQAADLEADVGLPAVDDS